MQIFFGDGNMKNYLKFLLLLFTLTIPVCAFAIPGLLTHQGHILDSTNTPVTGVANVTYTLYNSSDSAVWSETLSVTFDNGYYSVILGEESELAISILEEESLTLGITFDGNEEMSPRTPLAAVPWALLSRESETARAAQSLRMSNGTTIIDENGNWIGDLSVSGAVTLKLDSDGVNCGDSDGAGGLRWNSVNEELEVCDGQSWVPVGSGGGGSIPRITSINPNQIPPEDTLITLYGESFEDGCTVEFNGVESSSVTFESDTQVTATSGVLEPGVYDIRIINPTELRYNFRNSLTVDLPPVWETDQDLGFFSDEETVTVTLVATDAGTITYSLVSHGLPNEPTLDSDTGVLAFEPNSVSESTPYTFTVMATDNAPSPNSVVREFTISVTNCTEITGTVTFDFTGSQQTFTVPSCVTQLTVTAEGAEGAKAVSGQAYIPGKGGRALGVLDVTSGDTLYIFVGGSNGYNGGGAGWSGSSKVCNGGGASDVRVGGTALQNRVIVGAGGGGVSGESNWGNGGNGGGGQCGSNYCGGAKGTGYGFTASDGGLEGGAAGSSGHGGPGGGGGLQSGGHGARVSGDSAVAGTGTLGNGGDGAGNSSCCASYGIAGGGGGFYGGGGVAGSCCGGGGAGGGSSWTGILTDPEFVAGTRSGNGVVTINW